MIKQKPILFNTEMVKAVLDGRKTQTRRVIKIGRLGGGVNVESGKVYNFVKNSSGAVLKEKKCPYEVGGQLWVRETFCNTDDGYCYKANTTAEGDEIRKQYGYKWKPSIFMPKIASRITLEITKIRVERIQDITRWDAKREGVAYSYDSSSYPWYKNYLYTDEKFNKDIISTHAEFKQNPIKSFQTLWDSINEKRGYSWESNPWVFVYEFKVVKNV